ncbi:MAG: glycosyltransferase family 2 protein [Vicinamibacterales bacterium]
MPVSDKSFRADSAAPVPAAERGSRAGAPPARSSASLPFVSVLMPVRNEGAFMERSLGAVLHQTYPADAFEVIVADGMSTDATRETIKALAERHPNLQSIDNVGRIVSTGLNAALRRARGEIIIRVDGHCEIAPDYIERCVTHLRESGAEIVGGPLTTLGETAVAGVIAVAMSSPFGVGNSAFRTGQMTAFVDTVAFPAYPRRLLQDAGPFDEELVRNQDDEYNYRLRKMGARILLAQDVTSRYYSRSSFKSLWRQYFQYGYWKVRVMQKHPRQMRPRQFAPPLFVAGLAALLLLSIGSTWAALAFLGTVGLYLCANLAATIVTARQTGWRQMPALSLAFATLHVSYGAGFLVGLARFWNRWGDHSTFVGAPTLDASKSAPPAPRSSR